MHESEIGRYCCKSLKRRSGQFLAKERNERQSPINTASNPLRESPVSLARGDLSPTSLFNRRVYGAENLSPTSKKDFCNDICTFETCRLVLKMSASLIGRFPSNLYVPP